MRVWGVWVREVRLSVASDTGRKGYREIILSVVRTEERAVALPGVEKVTTLGPVSHLLHVTVHRHQSSAHIPHGPNMARYVELATVQRWGVGSGRWPLYRDWGGVGSGSCTGGGHCTEMGG